MTITVEATYEDGSLKIARPLPLKEHEKVQVTVEPARETTVQPADEAERLVRRSYGPLGWTGDVETLRRIAEDPEYSVRECP